MEWTPGRPRCRSGKFGQEVVLVSQYRVMLEQKFGVMYKYIDAVNAVALVISFLFIMVTLYTMVLQRTREIAILKSCGASKAFLWRQVLAESALLTGGGAAAGIALSFLGGCIIDAFTLYTVLITWRWIAIALLSAAAGMLASAAYPAWARPAWTWSRRCRWNEDGNQKSEVRDQRSEIRDQKSEIRNQKSEVRDHKLNMAISEEQFSSSQTSSAPAEGLLVACDLHKTYGKPPARVHVLRGANLCVHRGEFVAIMGPSGCGKSTLLHLLGLMSMPDCGRLWLNGQLAADADGSPGSAAACDDDVRTRLRRTHIGFVFQRFNLLPTLSALDNVAISLRVRGQKVSPRVHQLFQQLGVAHVANRKPGQMSIGEQQRVALIRGLAHRPALLLADEPTGNLDSANAAELLDLIRRVNQAENQTVLMITHSSEAAAR